MIRNLVIGSIVSGCLIGGAIGCGANNKSTANDAIKLDVKPSKRAVYTGETVTFFTESKNTLGKDAGLTWRTTGGQLTTEQNGRVARVKFDQVGNYTVTGMITVDGKEVTRQATEIEVMPIAK